MIPSWVKVGAKCVFKGSDSLLPDWGDTPPPNRVSVPSDGDILTINYIDLGETDDDIYVGVREYSPSLLIAIECLRPLITLRQDIRRIKSALSDMPITERLDRIAELLDQEEK